MDIMNATEVRKNWSLTLDSVVRERPAFIKRTRDEISMIDTRMLSYLLNIYKFNAKEYKENDGTTTLSLIEMDLVVNADSKENALDQMVIEIKEYANEYYDEFAIWSVAPNRKNHVPYVIKALTLSDEKIKEDIVCLSEKKS